MAERAFNINLPPGIASPSVHAALSGPVARIIMESWKQVAMADGHQAGGDYISGIMSQESLDYPYRGDPDQVAVINTFFASDWIDNGRAGFHLPSVIKKWKQGKNGPFVRVAFRHFTPTKKGGGFTQLRTRQAMPAAVHRRAARLPNGGRLAGFGDTYKQSKSYEFYRQIFADLPSELSDVRGYTWKSSPFEGLTRHTQVSASGKSSSTYSTVRTITPDSEGWYIPPMQARHYDDKAMTAAAPEIQRILDIAAARDLAASMGQALESA